MDATMTFSSPDKFFGNRPNILTKPSDVAVWSLKEARPHLGKEIADLLKCDPVAISCALGSADDERRSDCVKWKRVLPRSVGVAVLGSVAQAVRSHEILPRMSRRFMRKLRAAA